jgi:hypothetical protein
MERVIREDDNGSFDDGDHGDGVRLDPAFHGIGLFLTPDIMI